jgi:hypothetical protein
MLICLKCSILGTGFLPHLPLLGKAESTCQSLLVFYNIRPSVSYKNEIRLNLLIADALR